MKLRGYNLIKCISDCVNYQIPLKLIDYIVSDSQCHNNYDWDEFFINHADRGWRSIQIKARLILNVLVTNDLIHQPLIQNQQIWHPQVHYWVVLDDNQMPTHYRQYLKSGVIDIPIQMQLA